MNKQSKIFVALDYPTIEKAQQFIKKISPEHCGLKVGKELYVRAGPNFVKQLVSQGFDVFLDLKFHDIPNQVANAVAAAADLGVVFLTLHASGGTKMLTAAVEALKPYDAPPCLLAVTVLTSLSDADLEELGITIPIVDFASRLTTMAYNAGIRGFVCSALEVSILKKLAPGACFVTPGIRLQSSSHDDQTRVMTPDAAISAGADYLVIGRPITTAEDPIATLQQINDLLKGEFI